MAGYTHEYSQFPNALWEKHTFKDADDSIAQVLNNIKSLQSQGLYNQAQRIVEQNKDVLGQYMIDSQYFNHMDEEIRNLEIYARQVQQSIYIQTAEPSECATNDVWIGD